MLWRLRTRRCDRTVLTGSCLLAPLAHTMDPSARGDGSGHRGGSLRYLITGGAGFIGSHLADRLIARGDNVVLLDNLSTGSMGNIRHLVDAGRDIRRGIGPRSPDRQLHRRGLRRDRPPRGHRAASSWSCREPLQDAPEQRPRHGDRAGRRHEGAAPRSSSLRRRRCTARAPPAPSRRTPTGSSARCSRSRWSYAVSKEVDEIFAFEYWRERQLPPSSPGSSTASDPARPASSGWWCRDSSGRR